MRIKYQNGIKSANYYLFQLNAYWSEYTPVFIKIHFYIKFLNRKFSLTVTKIMQQFNNYLNCQKYMCASFVFEPQNTKNIAEIELQSRNNEPALY